MKLYVDRLPKNIHVTNFMKFRPVKAELFHEDGRTDMEKLIVDFRNFVNPLKITLPTAPFTHGSNYHVCYTVILPLAMVLLILRNTVYYRQCGRPPPLSTKTWQRLLEDWLCGSVHSQCPVAKTRNPDEICGSSAYVS
jgi:hypothetical protein